MKSILKFAAAPITMALSLFIWLCVGLISCSAFIFKLASVLLSILALAVLIVTWISLFVSRLRAYSTIWPEPPRKCLA